MKHGRKYKQKLSGSVNFDDDTRPLETVNHPYFTRPGEDLLTGEAANTVNAGQTRGEVEAQLKERGLSKAECEVVLLRHDRKSLRQIALVVGKSREWVTKTLRRVLPQAAQGGAAKLSASSSDAAKELPPACLKDAMAKAREGINNYYSPDTVEAAGHMASGLSELNLPPDASDSQTAVAMITCWPLLLRHPLVGPMLTERLADLLTTARYGDKTSAQRARDTLAPLTRYRQGNRCSVPDTVLASESLAICVTVAALQRAWRETGNGQTRAARVEAVRGQFALRLGVYDVTEGFTDQRLLSLLQADLLQASARLAEEATGIAAEAFIRAWRSQLQEEIQILQKQARP